MMSQNDGTIAASPTAPLSHVRQVDDLSGPAGRLEALLNTGSADAPFSAVICHPYPPAGGTMHTKVVYHTMKVLTALGIPVLRFNFRGVGRSAGAFDHGHGEQHDVCAALDWLDHTFRRPLLFAGFSFGSYVGLRASCSDPRIVARVALGLPVRAAGRDYSYEFLATCPGPMLFLSGSEDEFCPQQILHQVVGASHGRAVVLVPGADHFFQGTADSPASKLGDMQTALRGWLESDLLRPSANPTLNPHR